jgi:hypothetical protein
MFLDGAQIYTGSPITIEPIESPTRFTIGDISALDQSWNGWIDEVRITRGLARYTAAFTAPAAEFPDK